MRILPTLNHAGIVEIHRSNDTPLSRRESIRVSWGLRPSATTELEHVTKYSPSQSDGLSPMTTFSKSSVVPLSDF